MGLSIDSIIEGTTAGVVASILLGIFALARTRVRNLWLKFKIHRSLRLVGPPIGVLRWSLNYAKSTRQSFGGIFEAIKRRFAPIASKEFVKQIEKINGFRNTYVAHQEQPLEDVEQARSALKEWAAGLYALWKAHH
jgi:hypothetical protein